MCGEAGGANDEPVELSSRQRDALPAIGGKGVVGL
jgi:hypothetical protein